MRLGLTDDERAIDDVFGGFFRRECPPARVRAAEPLGFDGALWDRLAELGAPAMGVPEPAGGGGATLTDLAVVARAVGRSIAPVPFVDHAVASRAIAPFAAGLGDGLDGLLAGSEIATLALRPAAGGRFGLVPSGAVATAVVGMAGDDLVCVRGAPPGIAPSNHAAMPVADRATDESSCVVLATGAGAADTFARARAEWQTLTASALTGIAETAQQIAVQYVNERHQFGRPIGSFQALQQQLADLPIAIDGASLLSYKAAWAADRVIPGVVDVDLGDVTDFATLASMAHLFASDAAGLATDRALHAHGGYGYAEEYDIQLFYRRARGWSLVAGDPARECLRVADAMFGPARRRGA